MKVICDVHIPLRLVRFLQARGVEAWHVNQLPERWHTADGEIARFADAKDLLVITKDADFRHAFFLRRSPRKLLRICLGNITNDQLVAIFDRHLPEIQTAYNRSSCYLELRLPGITIWSPEV